MEPDKIDFRSLLRFELLMALEIGLATKIPKAVGIISAEKNNSASLSIAKP